MPGGPLHLSSRPRGSMAIVCAAPSVVLAIALLVSGCLGSARLSAGDARRDPELTMRCSGASIATQSELVEALVEGGLTGVRVAGWMCGRSEHGLFVRIVYLRYPANPAHEGLVPVIFEDGLQVGFRWSLLVAQPDRWGPNTPRPTNSMDPPDGWVAFGLDGGDRSGRAAQEN